MDDKQKAIVVAVGIICFLLSLFVGLWFLGSIGSSVKEYTVVIEGNGSFSGSINVDMQSFSFDNNTTDLNVNNPYQYVQTFKGKIIAVVVQKRDDGDYSLRAMIWLNNERVAFQETTARFGVVSVSYPH